MAIGMTIAQAQEEIIEEFGFFETWMEKYEHIIELGKELKGLPDDKKTEENLVKGCQSQVWLDARLEDGKLYFEADSDAIITKGLVGMIVNVLTGQSPKDIMAAELHFIDQVGLKDHLSPTRSNGLLSMVKKIKMYAIAFSAKVS